MAYGYGYGYRHGIGLGRPRLIVPGVTDNVIVSTTAQLATDYSSISNGFTSRRADYASAQGDITNIQCVDYKNYFDSSGGLHASDNHKVKRYLEYPAGVFHQVLWGGDPVLDFSSTGGTSNTSDVIISSVTGLPLVIPALAKFWWRTVNVTGSTVTKFPVIVRPASSQALGIDDGNSASDLGNSGTISATSTTNTFGPNGVNGTVLAANAKGFLIFGNSLAFGTGVISGVGSQGSSGWIGMGLDGRHPHVKMTAPGITAQEFVGMIGSTTLQGFMSRLGFTDVICELGINDLSLGSRSPAQVMADQQSLYNWAKTYNLRGNIRVGQTTITARTTSTDGWSSEANQTPKTDGTYGQVNDLNALIRGGPANVDYVIDAADFDMTVRDSVIHAGPYPCSTDGTHFDFAKAADMATKLSAVI